MADNNTNNRENNSPKKSNFIDRSIDDASESVTIILKTFLKGLLNPLFYIAAVFLLIPVIGFITLGPWNFGKGLLGINNSRNAIDDITDGSHNAGSYLREVGTNHKLNFKVDVEYIGDKKRNNRRSESITFEDINNNEDNRVIEVNDNN